MDEEKQKAHYRDKDEKNTQQRAAILGLEYLDTRGLTDQIELVPQMLSVEEMHKGRLVPLYNGNDIDPFVFGVTNNTPQ